MLKEFRRTNTHNTRVCTAPSVCHRLRAVMNSYSSLDNFRKISPNTLHVCVRDEIKTIVSLLKCVSCQLCAGSKTNDASSNAIPTWSENTYMIRIHAPRQNIYNKSGEFSLSHNSNDMFSMHTVCTVHTLVLVIRWKTQYPHIVFPFFLISTQSFSEMVVFVFISILRDFANDFYLFFHRRIPNRCVWASMSECAREGINANGAVTRFEFSIYIFV